MRQCGGIVKRDNSVRKKKETKKEGRMMGEEVKGL